MFAITYIRELRPKCVQLVEFFELYGRYLFRMPNTNVESVYHGISYTFLYARHFPILIESYSKIVQYHSNVRVL